MHGLFDRDCTTTAPELGVPRHVRQQHSVCALHCCPQPPQHADMRGGSSPSAGLSECIPTVTACWHRRCGMLRQVPPFFAQLPARGSHAHQHATRRQPLNLTHNPNPISCHSQYQPPKATLRPKTSDQPTGHSMHLDNITYWLAAGLVTSHAHKCMLYQGAHSPIQCIIWRE